jgi:thioredoxin-dependent peroxiredoxin
MVEERVGEAFELGEQLTVVGRRLRAGEAAPEFALERFDGEAMSTVRLADSAGSVRLLNVVNSLDTPVCQVETRRWEQSRGDLPAGVTVYTVSMDLPFAQKRFCGSEGIENIQTLSDFRGSSFGRAYGVLIKDTPLAGLLARALFVVDPAGTIRYSQIVPEIAQEPNYDEALNALRAAAG